MTPLARKFLYLLLIVIVMSFIYSVYAFGRSIERKDQDIVRLEALQRMAEESQKIRDQDIMIMMEATQNETRIIERIRTDRVQVVTPDCSDLGDDWVREANKIMGANP
jgi:precorrin-2 methylase